MKNANLVVPRSYSLRTLWIFWACNDEEDVLFKKDLKGLTQFSGEVIFLEVPQGEEQVAQLSPLHYF